MSQTFSGRSDTGSPEPYGDSYRIHDLIGAESVLRQLVGDMLNACHEMEAQRQLLAETREWLADHEERIAAIDRQVTVQRNGLRAAAIDIFADETTN